MVWAKTTARQHEKHFKFGYLVNLYYRFDGTSLVQLFYTQSFFSAECFKNIDLSKLTMHGPWNYHILCVDSPRCSADAEVLKSSHSFSWTAFRWWDTLVFSPNVGHQRYLKVRRRMWTYGSYIQNAKLKIITHFQIYDLLNYDSSEDLKVLLQCRGLLRLIR